MTRLLFVFLLASTSVAQAVCTPATINQATVQQIRLQMTPVAVSALLGCNPVELPAPEGLRTASTLLAWIINDGLYRKQISVEFAAGGGATRASYREIPLQAQAGGGGNDDRNLAALALLFAASGHAASSAINGGGVGVCTPATINPGAVQRVRPYMTPAAVSAVLGCAPTEIGPVWFWGIPLMKLSSKIHVAVVFDESGALTAQYQVIALGVPPICNGAMRVEPPTQIGNWVPGSCP